LCHDVCADNKWKMAIYDNICVLHHGKQTLYKNQLYSIGSEKELSKLNDKNAVPWETYKAEAMKTRDAYFKKHPLKHESFDSLVEYGLKYIYSEPETWISNLKSRLFIHFKKL